MPQQRDLLYVCYCLLSILSSVSLFASAFAPSSTTARGIRSTGQGLHAASLSTTSPIITITQQQVNIPQFFKNEFGKDVVYFPNANGDDKVFQNSLLFKNGVLDTQLIFDTSEHIALRTLGSVDYVNKATTSFQDFTNHIAKGNSAVIIASDGSALMPFKEQAEESLKGYNAIAPQEKISLNVYHSGPNAQALKRHYDSYDVFVVHMENQKVWEIGHFPEEYAIDLKDNKMENVVWWENVTLRKGDVLYIPKGVYHAAVTADGFDTTTHATFGIDGNEL